jgi:hypothetical protein
VLLGNKQEDGMNFTAGAGNPDERVRKAVRLQKKREKEKKKTPEEIENECRFRAHAAALCGKPDTAFHAISRANEIAEERRLK